MGVTTGIGRNRFGYGRTITRGEFISMLVDLLGCGGETSAWFIFDNTDPDKFYFGPIEAALENGIITNEPDVFRPNDPVTRQEAVIMIVNSFGYGELAAGWITWELLLKM